MAEEVAKDHFEQGEVILTPAEMPTLSEALTKFKQLDVDKSGELSQVELKDLANWIYTTFSSNGTLSEEQLDTEAGKLLRKLDKDKSEGVSYEEFEKFYTKKLQQAAKLEAARAAKSASATG